VAAVGFVRVAASADVGGAPFLRVDVDGTEVLLGRLDDGTVRAFSPRCPHLHQPLTSAIVTGNTLECPFHFYAYDLDTGRNTFPGETRDLDLPVHDVLERDGEVLVRLRA
jgi:nitrite reductase/ring-hydroxylating ferredoxin subunit